MPRKAATALAALLVFGSASTVLANASDRTDDHGSLAQRPKSITANGRTGADNGAAKPFTIEEKFSFAASRLVWAQSPGQSMTAVYFDPNPAPFKAFTYCASVPLGPSTSKRVLQGEFRFPAFSATPNVSVQIISSIGAVPMQVRALKIQETPGLSGRVETQIVVEAETVFDVPAGGIYYANLVVIGVPVVPPVKGSSAAELSH
jgi:hypothetical protein